jgi:hypothetical protein
MINAAEIHCECHGHGRKNVQSPIFAVRGLDSIQKFPDAFPKLARRTAPLQEIIVWRG